MRMLKRLAVNLGLIAASLLVFILMAEIVLRFLPVMSGLQAMAVNDADPVLHFQPNNEYVYSKGPLLEMVNRGHVNNLGYVNDQDYTSDPKRPLIAVIGDSYIEALMVPYPDTLQGRLAKALKDQASVYSFAASGAALSQYLVWADYARRNFRPDAMIFVVVGNDFDESLVTYKRAPGFYGFQMSDNGMFELERMDFQPSIARRLLRKSALVRYLVLNGNIESMMGGIKQKSEPKADAASYAGNTSSKTDPKRLTESRQAVQEFLNRLPAASDLPAERILFLVDGFRYPKRAQDLANSYFGEMRGYFLREASARGYEAVDMDTPFFQNHAQSKAMFEFPTDGHWNATAHGIAADQALKSKTINAVTHYNK